MNRASILPSRLTAGIGLAWGALVWANWFSHNALSFNGAYKSLAAFGRVDWQAALHSLGPNSALLAKALLICVAAYSAGCAAASLLGIGRKPWVGLARLALGGGLIGTAVLGLGFAGLALPRLAWTLLVLLSLSGAGKIRKGLRHAVNGALRRREELSFPILALALAVLLPLGASLLGSLAPGIAYDGLFHHLAHPSIFADRHKVVALPHHFLSYYPALLEMNYLLGFLLGGGPALGKIIHYLWGLLALGVVIGWTREKAGLGWALAAGACFVNIPYVQLVLMWAYVDLGAAAYLAISLWAGLSGGGAVVLGLLCGFCAATKVSGIFAVILGAGLVLLRRKPGGKIVRFAAVCVLVGAPWVLRNWLFSGNPAVPFLGEYFPTLFFEAGNLSRYRLELGSYLGPGEGGLGPLGLLAWPWAASVRNLGVLDRMGGMSAWFLCVLPLFLVIRERQAKLPVLLVLGYFLLWLAIPRQVRYLLPVWPVGCVAVALVLKAFQRMGGPARLVFAGSAFILAAHVVMSFDRQYRTMDPVKVALGTESVQEYIERGIGGKPYSARMMAWTEKHLAGQRTLIVSDYCLGMLWGPKAIFQSAFDTPLIERFARESPGPERILVKFRQLGVKRVIYAAAAGFPMQQYRIYSFDPESARRWRDFWRGYASEVYAQNDRYFVYEIGRGAGGVSTLPGIDEQALASLDEEVREAQRAGNIEGMLPGFAQRYERIGKAWDSAYAYERLGIVLMKMSRVDEARRALRQAESRGRDTAMLNYASGLIASHMGEIGEAIRRLRASLDRDPDLGAARLHLARILLQLDRHREAIELIQAGLERDPANAELHAELRRAARGGPGP